MGNDHLLHLLLRFVDPGYSRLDCLLVRIVRPHEAKERGSQPVNLLLLLCYGCVKGQRLLLERLKLVGFQGQLLEKMGTAAEGTMGRNAVPERSGAIPRLFVMGVPRSTEERDIEDQRDDKDVFQLVISHRLPPSV